MRPARRQFKGEYEQKVVELLASPGPPLRQIVREPAVAASMPLKCLIKSAGREIFLIVDRGPAYRMRKAGAFVRPPGAKLRWFFSPPRAPDRNPGALVWKHRNAAGRTAITGKDGFNRKV
jgi:hypothetical protein